MLSLSIPKAKQPSKAKSPISRRGSSANTSLTVCCASVRALQNATNCNAKAGEQHEGVMEDLWQFLG